jgi:hypothetical protein
LSGNLEEAIELTYQLFPGILERNKNLLFALKVRQFIEMINNANTSNTNIDDIIVTNNDQENQNLSDMNSKTNTEDKIQDYETNETINTRLLPKNGFSNSDNSFEKLKDNDYASISNEEAMGRLFKKKYKKNLI